MASKCWSKRICCLFLVLLGTVGCATSTETRLKKLTIGLDKTGVLDTAGNPHRSERRSGGDVWTYIYFVDDHRFERDLRFESGKLVSISEPKEVPRPTDSDDVIIKDYQQLVDEAKTKSGSKSKDEP